LIFILLLAYKESFPKGKSCLKISFGLCSKNMKKAYFFALLTTIILSAIAFGQQPVIINNPSTDEKPKQSSAATESLIKRQVLPKARKHWAASDACEEDFAVMGEAKGAFTKANPNQTLVFYQFCQTGNGFGNNGLVLIENGKIVRNYVSEGGWALNLRSLPDINQNGLNEFLVYYSGGLHQGAGGTGVDIMEFSAGGVRGLGWFQAYSFNDEDENFAYKVSVKPGKTPIFYREKYVSTDDEKWQKSSKPAKFALNKTYGKFSVLK